MAMPQWKLDGTMLEIYCISEYVMAVGQFCEITEQRFLGVGLRSEVEREGENQS
jgi:hypothetical protein